MQTEPWVTEAQTRSELIDQQLGRSGWNVKDPIQVVEEFDILTSLPEGSGSVKRKSGYLEDIA